MRRPHLANVGLAALLTLAFAAPPPARAQEEPAPGPTVERLDLNRATVADAARLIAETAAWNIIATPEAGAREVTLLLQGVSMRTALESLCKASSLWYREEDGVIRIMTADEYQKDLVVQRDPKVRVFTLLHPNAVAVAGSIRDLFGSRVQLSLGLSDSLIQDPSLSGQGVNGSGADRFSDRLQGLQGGLFQGNNGTSGFGFNGNGNNGNNLGNDERQAERLAPELTAEQLSRVQVEDGRATGDLEGLTEGRPTIAVTVNRRHNIVVVRTADEDALTQIERLVVDLDRPTPQVLLEMKILELRLGDGQRTGLDVDLVEGPTRTNLPTGEPTNPLVAGAATVVEQVLGAGNPPLAGGALVYQFLNEHVRVRLEALGREDRVSILATPMLLCANNETARIFIGEERPLVRNFQLQTITTNGVVTNQVVPTVDLRDIGNSLRIIPRINADRTVTLTIVQDVSTVNIGGAQLPVPGGANGGVTIVDIDTVDTANLQGTVVAKDGLTMAVGGLIRKEMRDRQVGIPYLMELPFIGWLFGETERVEEQRELILLITPHVLMTPTEGQERSRERLEALSLHPYHDLGDQAVQRYDRSDAPGSDRYRLLIDDYLRPAAEPIR